MKINAWIADPGVSSMRVIYTIDVGGVAYVGLDAYLAIGKVVGVMSCAAPRQNLADLDTWCSSYGATFGGKLGAVYDAYG